MKTTYVLIDYENVQPENVAALFLHKLSEAELAALLAELQTKGIVAVTGTKVSYSLPS